MTILTDNDPVLRQKSEAVPVKEITKPETREFALALWNTMVENNGVGIAAVQVGVLKKIICVNTPQDQLIMFNAKVMKQEGFVTMNEGCLSFPDTFREIKRGETVTVHYRNINGKVRMETFSGLTARVLLHEIDHTNGIVFTER